MLRRAGRIQSMSAAEAQPCYTLLNNTADGGDSPSEADLRKDLGAPRVT